MVKPFSRKSTPGMDSYTAWLAFVGVANINIANRCTLALVYIATAYASEWYRSTHTKKMDVPLNNTMHIITECMRQTEKMFLLVLSGIAPPDIRCKCHVMNFATSTKEHDHHLFYHHLSAATQVQ